MRADCEHCRNQPGVLSAVIGGTYYRQLCHDCKHRLTATYMPSSGQASYNRQRDLEDHEADIQQPWGADGKPNSAFIRLYPEKARTHFSDEEMRKYG